MKTKLGTILGAVLGSILFVAQTACLTPEQQAKLVKYEDQLAKSEAALKALGDEYDKYKVEVEAVLDKIATKEVPMAEGMALVRTYLANQDTTMARISDARKELNDTKKNISDLKAQGMPWWAIAGPLVVSGLGIAALFIPALSPLAAGLAAAQASARSAYAQVTTVTGKLDATEEAFGSASRTLDELAKTDPKVAAKKAELMTAEQASDVLADKSLYDALRAKAAAGLL